MPSTREEINKRMDELVRKYVETHDPEIIKELYQLARQLQGTKKAVKFSMFNHCVFSRGQIDHQPMTVIVSAG